MTEDEMVGWHHQLDGHGFGQTPAVGDGQGSLACCGSWGRKESDTTEQLNRTPQASSEALEASWHREGANSLVPFSRVNFPQPSLSVQVPPKADLEARITGQVVYWGGDVRKRGHGENEIEKEEKSVKKYIKERITATINKS